MNICTRPRDYERQPKRIELLAMYGQTVAPEKAKRLIEAERARITRAWNRRVRIGRILAFMAPAVVPVLNAISWAIEFGIIDPLSKFNNRRNRK